MVEFVGFCLHTPPQCTLKTTSQSFLNHDGATGVAAGYSSSVFYVFYSTVFINYLCVICIHSCLVDPQRNCCARCSNLRALAILCTPFTGLFESALGEPFNFDIHPSIYPLSDPLIQTRVADMLDPFPADFRQ